MMPGGWRAALAAWPSVLLAGCSVLGAGAQDHALRDATVLAGRVEAGVVSASAVVVGAYARDRAGWRLEHQTRLHEPGAYELIVSRGEYVLFAFADRNGNGLFDDGEPAASHGDGHAVSATGHGLVSGLDIVLAAGGTAVPRITPASMHSTQAGALADLDAPTFAAEQGERGYWRPVSFFREWGGNVYFIEPYEPSKIPVLFVHGAAGSAQDWRSLIQRLDRRRYQPWLFFYPSGSAVESMSHLLYWKLLNLQLRHRFERLDIVAHSMGGLVVRRFLLDHGLQFPQARRFVSLSTPWAGEPSADLGVRYSPGVVPSWRDMQPDGAFMRSLFDRHLPAQVDYHLLFGHRGGYSLVRPNHDGTVTLASQLRRAAQAEAKLIYGFDEDHTSILHAESVARQLQVLLDADERRPGTQGRLRVRLDYGDAAPSGLATLVLRALDAAAGPRLLTLTLPPANGAAPIGPLPAGRYDAGLLAAGFAAQPRWQRLDLPGDGRTPELVFRLHAQGTLSGYVGEAVERAVGAYRAPDPTLRLRSITLRGAGLTRTLLPGDGGLERALERMLDGEDAVSGVSFAFGNLPEGDYDLVVEADGRAPHRSTHRVTPGRPGPLLPIVLEPLR